MARKERTRPGVWGGLTDPHVKGGGILGHGAEQK